MRCHVPLATCPSGSKSCRGKTDTSILRTRDTCAHKARRFGAFERRGSRSRAAHFRTREHLVVVTTSSVSRDRRVTLKNAHPRDGGVRESETLPRAGMPPRRALARETRIRRAVSSRIPGGSADLTATFSYSYLSFGSSCSSGVSPSLRLAADDACHRAAPACAS